MSTTLLKNGIRFGRRLYHANRRRLQHLREGKPADFPSLVAQTLDVEDEQCARSWLSRRDDWYDPEPVRQYEDAFATMNGSDYAVALMGGRVALSAAIHALELEPGDEVVLPAFTCIVVPNAFRYAGVHIRFADIELDTYGPEVSSVKAALTSQTSAILIHHLFGLVCRDYEALLELANNRNVAVIEDCTHATGATFKGQPVGNLGDVAFYSSEHSKVFSTAQGGMATTNDERLGSRLRAFANAAPLPSASRTERLLHTFRVDFYAHAHPRPWLFGDYYRERYKREYLTSTVESEMRSERPAYYGQRMPAPLAALGLKQIAKLDAYAEQRRETARRWDRWCTSNGYACPLVLPDSSPAWLRYPVLVPPEKKEDLTWALEELGVQPGVWFKTNLHPVKDSVFEPIRDTPAANRAVCQCINLPTLLN